MAKAVAATPAKPTLKKAQGNGKRMPSASSDDSESSSEESNSDDEVSRPVKPTPAPVKKTTACSDDSSGASSSEESSSEEDSDSGKKGKASVKTTPVAVKKAADSSDESSSEDSDSKDNEISEPVTTPAEVKRGAESSHESSAASSDDSDSEEEDDEMAEPVATPAKANKKRNAESEIIVAPKKVKLADGNASAVTSNEETKSIFVGRLSWNVDNDWLAQEFAECGEVESAFVAMDRNTGRSRGFGYVHFKTADAVEKALALNGREIDGRAVNIDKSNPPDKKASAEKRAQTFGDTSSPPSAVLFVGNLSFGVNEDTLWETFGEHGDVKSVRVPTDRDTGKPKGFAYVEFSDAGSAKKALGALQGFEFDGRSIRLDFSQPRDNTGGRGGAPSGRGGRGRGGFRGDRGRGGGAGRGAGRGGRGGDWGARGRGRGARTGGITHFEGQKITFD